MKTIIKKLMPRKSVATITGSLRKTVAALEAHGKREAAESLRKQNQAAKLHHEAMSHEGEMKAAQKVAENIKALLG